MILRATHSTVYGYPSPASDSHNELRLQPLTDHHQVCLDYRLETEPYGKFQTYEEPGGIVQYFEVRQPHSSLEITATTLVETFSANPFSGLNLLEPDWDAYQQPHMKQEYAEFLAPSFYAPDHAGARDLAHRVRMETSGSVANYLIRLNQAIYSLLRYMPGATGVHTTLDEVFDLHAGVCQDFAHLMIACCRSQHIPARYVSGYLYSGDTHEFRGEQATHAWLECPMPDGRWLALDPTNNVLANDHYIRIHTGRDYKDVTPCRGVYTGRAATSLEVSVRVERAEKPAFYRQHQA